MKQLLALLLLLLFGCLQDAEQLFREQQFTDAAKLWSDAATSSGERAPQDLLVNLALASFRANDLRVAEISIERAAALDSRSVEVERDLLMGALAFRRSEAAELAAYGPVTGIPTLSGAIQQAETCLQLWSTHYCANPDDERLRRNLERVVRRLDILRAKQNDLDEQRRARRPGRAKPKPPPEEHSAGREKTETPASPREMDPQHLLKLMKRLESREKEKLAGRRNTLFRPGGGLIAW